jgi:endonuclease YncB( thermonuclease family)
MLLSLPMHFIVESARQTRSLFPILLPKSLSRFHIFLTAIALISLSCEDKVEFLVVRVIDGDTIVLENNERVRYIGIDTPELSTGMKVEESLAFEAKAYNQELVEGKRVRLEIDKKKRDRFGRILAYVYRGGMMINMELLRVGLARQIAYPPNLRYQKKFEAVETEAKRMGRGLWRKEGGLLDLE